MNWSGKRILLTGHTGFKGGWLSLWLQQMGADLCGIALAPPAQPNLFEQAAIARGMRSVIGDIRNVDLLRQTFSEHQPEIIFHLAAQPLVRASYQDPLGTYSTNVMGTANVLDAARTLDSLRAIVIVTTDKCYENREWTWPYRESDQLGGYDPYSNSKACAELVVSAYRNSFFHPQKYSDHGVAIASARAGNVIGGGDWAEDRLIPDIIRAFTAGSPVSIRNPNAIRPWQHVLEPLRGYLTLAESLLSDGPENGEAWNFGPNQSDARPVQWIVEELARAWGLQPDWAAAETAQPHEAQQLKLDCSKAQARLDWAPSLQLKESLTMTANWYKSHLHKEDMHQFTRAQIQTYTERFASGLHSTPNDLGVEA